MTSITGTADDRVRQVVSQIRNLPTPPIVFHQIQKVINDPNSSATQVAAVLSEDPAMSVKVLKLTNSAFYGLAREVTSVQQAVVIVGMEAVRNLVLSASVLDMFRGEEVDNEFQESFWRHSLATAFACRMICKQRNVRGKVEGDSAFSAGLLHDIGKVILHCYLPEDAARFRAARDKDDQSTDVILEDQVLDFTHAQVGGHLAVHWKLPSGLAEAITLHHHPHIGESEQPLAHVVHMADYLAKRTFYDRSQSHLVGYPAPGVAEYLGLDEEMMSDLAARLPEEYAHAETFMQLAGIS